jgi:ABC-type branched-subunit amino acid transport system ATPase component/ABC-type branched-subunit amino acid transport system permease subunit
MSVGGLQLNSTFVDLLMLNAMYAYSAYYGMLAGGFCLLFGGTIAIGSYAVALFILHVNSSVLLGAGVAAVIAAVAGAVLAIPLRRLAGIYLAIVSIAFVDVVQTVAINWKSLTQGALGLILPVTAQVGTTTLIIVVACLLLVSARIHNSTFGLVLKLRRHDPLLAETMGVNGRRVWYWLAVASCALAGIAGAFNAAWFGTVSPGTFSFSLIVTIVAMVVLGGSQHWIGPLVGAAVFTALPEILQGDGQWSTIVTGIVLLVVVVLAPSGVVGQIRLAIMRRRSRRGKAAVPEDLEAPASATAGAGNGGPVTVAPPSPRERHLALQASDLSWGLSGLAILSDVSIELVAGEICALIGPNGSGKSSLLNLLTGITVPNQGQISVGDRDMTGRTAHDYALNGVGRTFQEVRLLEEETAINNVRAAAWRTAADGTLWRAFLSAPRALRASRKLRASAKEMLAISGAAEFSGWLAGDVSYGTRRKIELARGLITGPDILLLDEPTSGVSRDHVDVIKRLILREANRGCAVLIVDHDLDVIDEICDRVVVLDAGKKIYDGPVRAAFEDPTVQLAYVGS